MSKHAIDPEKVSHHIHRIGYHFDSGVVDNAREKLGYVYYRGKFIKEDVMQAQRSKGRVKNIMAKYGLKPLENDARETPEQVSAFIKELFPRIPQEDLDLIVEHAWKEGSQRVGTNENMTLVNRVQLAVTARIRHAYTDYDRLLKAFEWKDARMEVEPVCVMKLKEWRGEDANEEDDRGFEETLQDVIVIDDDDDDNMKDDAASESDEDDVSVGDADDASDSSVEIVEHRITDNDFAAESILRPTTATKPTPQMTLREWSNEDGRRQAQIQQDEARRRNAEQYRSYGHSLPPPPPTKPTYVPQQYPQQPPQYQNPLATKPVVVSMPQQDYRVRERNMQPGSYVLPQAHHHPYQPGPYQQLSQQQAPPRPVYPPYEQPAVRHKNGDPSRQPVVYAQDPYFVSTPTQLQDRPLPSIERDDGYRPVPPSTSTASWPAQMQHTGPAYNGRSTAIVDLTTPPPQLQPQRHYYPPPPMHGAPHPAQFYGR